MGRKRSKSTHLTIKDAELDRISCLPGHVIDQILSLMPIKEAVRTSVLSSSWRNKWYTLPNLVFNKHCISVAASKYTSVINNKFLRIVDHVLLQHSGPINKFMLSDNENCLIRVCDVSDVHRWVLHLSRRSIKELLLHFWLDKRYKIPLSLFSCQSLRHLSLSCCQLKLPTTFEGFKNLQYLHLEEVTLAQDDFENMISGCPLLDHLVLMKIDGFSQINVHAPNLSTFQFYGKFEDISFQNSSQIYTVYVDLSIYLNSKSNQSKLHGCSSNLLKFFAHQPHIQFLEIGYYFLKYLAADDVPVKLPAPCISLCELSLCINFNDLKEISAALCLLRSSPNLKKLEIFARIEEETVLLTPTSYCWEDIFSGPAMPIQVQHVTIDGISGIRSELDFIRFLLRYSPVLEKMIVKHVVNVQPELITELLRFKRASDEAEVIYLEKEEEASEQSEAG
ncbi:putative F-box domain, FBD domain, leucine-rich repeat domain, L domain-containing protein [Medicago truncatula]|uniref:F-box/RNI/FBD-like domain protein n=1 Tax=Medicago truncatula TaxID=3880 RepID=G7I7L0_MEDTR|nr:F-box/FBD/LRR-repeat protein At1g13570 isoform X1 [Medicago truncatula]AES59062.1 F-box/RNI/FBD-like domain protein [Medicago truncatula]RHN77038.1 putative F-box domain, FBD domain, leucine-rich repeat domain, L domain-containing protein [Medicago truncatula]